MKTPKFDFVEIAGLGTGGAASSLVSDKLLGTQGNIVKRVVPFGIGIVLSGMSNGFLRATGKGMISGSVATALQETVPGLAEDVMINDDVFVDGPDNSSPYVGSSESNEWNNNNY